MIRCHKKRLAHVVLKGNSVDFKHQSHLTLYRGSGNAHVKTSCMKSLVAWEGAAPSLINCISWYENKDNLLKLEQETASGECPTLSRLNSSVTSRGIQLTNGVTGSYIRLAPATASSQKPPHRVHLVAILDLMIYNWRESYHAILCRNMLRSSALLTNQLENWRRKPLISPSGLFKRKLPISWRAAKLHLLMKITQFDQKLSQQWSF